MVKGSHSLIGKKLVAITRGVCGVRSQSRKSTLAALNCILLKSGAWLFFSKSNQSTRLSTSLQHAAVQWLRMECANRMHSTQTHAAPRMILTFQCFYLVNCDSHWVAKDIENHNNQWFDLHSTKWSMLHAHFTNQNGIVFDAQLVGCFLHSNRNRLDGISSFHRFWSKSVQSAIQQTQIVISNIFLLMCVYFFFISFCSKCKWLNGIVFYYRNEAKN